MSIPERAKTLPRLDAAAYQGTAGRIVERIAPHTEADPLAVLVSVMAAAGAMFGDGPHVMAGGSRHPARIWPLLIGRTAAGRKGESWAQAERLITEVDSYFVTSRIPQGGLSTGEGIIAAFRDDEDEDHPERDKRMLIVEAEFARPLAVARREGNTLSAVLRTLWETGRANVLTRGDPLACTGAHLVIVGHVTPRELRLKLADSDLAGGLMNRFLPVAVERWQLLPDETDPPDLSDLAHLMRDRLRAARSRGRMHRTDAANRLWREAYQALAEDEADGPLGEILARGPAYILRMALIYALMDGDEVIDRPHLLGGLAIWHYVTASARHVFGDMSGNSDLDRLRRFVADAPRGRTRTELSNLFARNRKAEEIDALLAELEDAGDIAQEAERTGRAGRPTVRIFWTGAPLDNLGDLLARNDETNDLTQKGDAA